MRAKAETVAKVETVEMAAKAETVETAVHSLEVMVQMDLTETVEMAETAVMAEMAALAETTVGLLLLAVIIPVLKTAWAVLGAKPEAAAPEV